MHFISSTMLASFAALSLADTLELKGEPVATDIHVLETTPTPLPVQEQNLRAADSISYTMVPATITTGGITVVVSTPSIVGPTAAAATSNGSISKTQDKASSTATTAPESTTVPSGAGNVATPLIRGVLVAGLAALLF
ncbi:hypothetical protein Micbo1qcDRAFT_208284 [Microdochium bolleyi]|uniref:GPI anchored protein n=1 Tax=Microdochium bolleyi TaxID=196109 RepID=A0A136IQV5_9PEZI|nr:hypothetical protein Micbo1qcDRAFT_208284 [Microdochium bolleyi]